MNIAYITNRFPPAYGGGERFIALLLDELAQNNDFKAKVYSSNFLSSNGNKRIKKANKTLHKNIKHIQLPSFRLFGKDALTIYPTLGFIGKELNKFDLIHVFTYGYMTSWLPLLMKRLGLIKKPIIFQPFYAPNSIYPSLVTNIFDKTLGSNSISHADATVLISPIYKTFFKKSKDIQIISPPIKPIERVTESASTNLKKELDIPLDNKIILALSRFAKSKGNHLLISGFSKYLINTKDLNTHLVIAGQGEEYENLLNQREELRLESKITILQNVKDETREILFNMATIFSLLSFSGEAFGITQIEAMSLGKPILGSNKGAIPFVTEKGINGEIVDPFSADEIATAIEKLLKDPKKYSKRNIEKAKLFLPDKIAKEYMNLYKKTIQNRFK